MITESFKKELIVCYLNEQSRTEVRSLINESKVVCANCFLKLENDIIDIM